MNSFGAVQRDPSVIACNGGFKSDDNCKRLSFEDSNIKVFLRIRPQEGNDLIDFSIDESVFEIKNSKSGVGKSFTFSNVFPGTTTQREVYNTCVGSLMTDFLSGNNATIMAYGTSGAGKTHSILGTIKSPGLVPRILFNIFKLIPSSEHKIYMKPNDNMEAEILSNIARNADIKNLETILKSCQQNKRRSILAYASMEDAMNNDGKQSNYIVEPNCRSYIWISFAEIYNENVYDLLDTKTVKNGQTRPKLKLQENKHATYYVKGLTKVLARSGEEAYKILKYGQRNLQYAATKINMSSSRSHCVFTIYLVKSDNTTATVSRFNFCDLAGSERVSNTNHTGMRLKESQAINSALHVLGRCIKIIKENQMNGTKQMVPFRESKLTRLFHKALLGQERLSLLVNVHPKQIYFEETMNSLNFASLAKEIVLDAEQCTRISRINVTKYFNCVPSSTIREEVTVIESDEYDSQDESEASYSKDELYEFINERDARIQELEIEQNNLKMELIDIEQRTRAEVSEKFRTIINDITNHYEKLLKNAEMELKTYQSMVGDVYEDNDETFKSEPNLSCSLGQINESQIINISDDYDVKENTAITTEDLTRNSANDTI